MSKVSKHNSSDEEEEVCLFDSDNSETEELDDYDLLVKDIILSSTQNSQHEINKCEKMESLSRNKFDSAVTKISKILQVYDYESLCYLVSSLLLEYYYSGWVIRSEVSKKITNLFDDHSSGWDDEIYVNMLGKCKSTVESTLDESSIINIASYLLYECYFGDGGCIFSETYEYVNNFLSALSS